MTESIPHNDGFLGFGPDSELASNNNLEHRVRRISLYYKAGEHRQEPSVWSHLVDGILAIPHKRTPEETDACIKLLAHAWLYDSSKARWDYWKITGTKFGFGDIHILTILTMARCGMSTKEWILLLLSTRSEEGIK